MELLNNIGRQGDLGNFLVCAFFLSLFGLLEIAMRRHELKQEKAAAAVRATQGHGVSGETNLAEAISHRFEPFGGVDDLEPHPPVTVGEPPAFDQRPD